MKEMMLPWPDRKWQESLSPAVGAWAFSSKHGEHWVVEESGWGRSSWEASWKEWRVKRGPSEEARGLETGGKGA